MPPANFSNSFSEDDTQNSNEFPLDLLAMIIPIGILICASCYLCCLTNCYYPCKYPHLNRNRNRTRYFSSDSISSISSGLSYPTFVSIPKPSIFFIKDMKQSRVDNLHEVNDVCSICIEAYEEQDLIVTMPCGHQYHKPCIYPWLKNNIDCGNKPTCPMCKSELVVDYRDKVEEQDIGVIIEKNN